MQPLAFRKPSPMLANLNTNRIFLQLSTFSVTLWFRVTQSLSPWLTSLPGRRGTVQCRCQPPWGAPSPQTPPPPPPCPLTISTTVPCSPPATAPPLAPPPTPRCQCWQGAGGADTATATANTTTTTTPCKPQKQRGKWNPSSTPDTQRLFTDSISTSNIGNINNNNYNGRYYWLSRTVQVKYQCNVI